jgi:hypothetical protein
VGLEVLADALGNGNPDGVAPLGIDLVGDLAVDPDQGIGGPLSPDEELVRPD